MAETSGISWTDATFNPWIGCTAISAACASCYAEVSTPARSLGVIWGPGQERRRTSAQNWKLPTRWNRQPFWQCLDCGARFSADADPICASCAALATGTSTGTRVAPARRRVFCASLADVFDNEVDPAWRADLFELIAATPNLDWLVLTKRIGNVQRMVEAAGLEKLPDNVWLGATVVTQEEADRDVPKLVATPASIRFLSMEPLLGPVNLAKNLPAEAMLRWYRPMISMLDWVIVGGESGSKARPMHPDWARSLRDQCAAARVPFLFKQWGEFLPAERAPHPDYPGSTDGWRLDQAGRRWHRPNESAEAREQIAFAQVGKREAGDHLDGKQHHAWPAMRT